jgi:hypothetical protein
MRNLLIEAVKNPEKIFIKILDNLAWVPDPLYLRMLFRLRTGKKLNLEHPKTFNEKLQWLKLYDRKPEYTQMVDKYAAREWICRKLRESGYENPEEFLPVLYGRWNSFDEIDFPNLPDSFVLKTNNDSGTVILVPDKSKFDAKAARKKLTRGLAKNYFKHGREYQYKDIKPCIIAEEYLGDNINDYKLFCFERRGEERRGEEEERFVPYRLILTDFLSTSVISTRRTGSLCHCSYYTLMTQAEYCPALKV